MRSASAGPPAGPPCIEAVLHRIILLPALILIGGSSGCASRIDSPREPFMVAQTDAIADAGADRRSRDAFDVLDDWHWPDTLGGTARVAAARDALATGMLGLHSAQGFRLVDGTCSDCPASPAALWHFRDEVIAVPGPGIPAIGSGQHPAGEPSSLHPSLVWIGAPEVIDRARVGADGLTVSANGDVLSLALPPRNRLDRSDVDASTASFFNRREVRLRGSSLMRDGRNVFIARTIWPHDSRIEKQSVALAPLQRNELLSTLIDAQVVGAASAFPARLLFDGQQDSTSWAGKPVLAMVLSGAQGDDDGARAGHLGVATGVFGPRGEWSDWLVENFYPHQVSSAKNIISASVPIDNYLLDVNSGQLFFRPAYMLVAVLRRPDAAHEISNALHRSLLDYYCRRFEFDRAARNSTAMSIDPVRELGWRIPAAGPTSRVVGLLGAPLATVFRLSFSEGREFFHMMSNETTRLLPRVAFEVAGHDLLYLVQARPREAGLTRLERMLVNDVEAVLFVRLPQIPSTRRYGTYPPRALLQYGARALSAPSEFETAPDGEDMTLPDDLKRGCEMQHERAGASRR
jgi:hypothetical protein